MITLDIRSATMDDLKTITTIETTCFPPAEAAKEKDLRERLEVFPDGTLIGYLEGKPIGFIGGMIIPEPIIADAYYHSTDCFHPDNPYLAVYGLNVLPDFRRQGFAGQLIQAYLQLARSRKDKAVVLTCKEHLKPFYESQGFICKGISDSTHGGATWFDMIAEVSSI